jgi:hypothetical protein
MIEITGNIWNYYNKGEWIVITTNGTLNKQGHCVMGKGIALQAKVTFPIFPIIIGRMINKEGNHCYVVEPIRLISFPVKHNWWDKQADLDLVRSSCVELGKLTKLLDLDRVYLPKVATSNGHRDWDREVRPILKKHLDDKFFVVS